LLHNLKVLRDCNLSKISTCGPLELPSTLGIRPHLEPEGPGSTHESQKPQPLELRFRATLVQEPAVEVALA
jgi:hypothetical protein